MELFVQKYYFTLEEFFAYYFMNGWSFSFTERIIGLSIYNLFAYFDEEFIEKISFAKFPNLVFLYIYDFEANFMHFFNNCTFPLLKYLLFDENDYHSINLSLDIEYIYLNYRPYSTKKFNKSEFITHHENIMKIDLSSEELIDIFNNHGVESIIEHYIEIDLYLDSVKIADYFSRYMALFRIYKNIFGDFLPEEAIKTLKHVYTIPLDSLIECRVESPAWR